MVRIVITPRLSISEPDLQSTHKKKDMHKKWNKINKKMILQIGRSYLPSCQGPWLHGAVS